MTFSTATLSPRSQQLIETEFSYKDSQTSNQVTVKMKEIIPAALSVLQSAKTFKVGIGLIDGRCYWFDQTTSRTYVVDLNFFTIVKTLAEKNGSKILQNTTFYEAEEQLIGPSERSPSAYILYLKA